MPTVFEVLLQTARRLDAVVEGAATAEGTPMWLIDTRLADYRNDGFNGGALFLKTNQNVSAQPISVDDESLGKIVTTRTLIVRLLNTPVRPGTIVITSAGATFNDDGHGRFASSTGYHETAISMSAGAGPWDLQRGNLTPGSVKIRTSGASPRLIYVDNGDGLLFTADTGVYWGTIDYDAGIVTGSSALGAIALADFYGTDVLGTVDYASGMLNLRFSSALSDEFLATYDYGYQTFIPLIMNVTDFTAATGRIDFEPSAQLSLATSKDDLYGMTSKRYPRWLLFSKLNEVLADIRDYVTDTDVLITALTNGCETLVDAEKRIVEVLVAQASTGDRAWTRLTRWQHVNGVLRIESDLTNYTTLRVRTLAPVARVDAEIETVTLLGVPTLQAVEISDYYSVSWLAVATAARCVRWRLQQPGAEAQLLTALLNQLMSDEVRERSKNRRANPVTMRLQLQEWPES